MRMTSEFKRILTKDPADRTEHGIYYVSIESLLAKLCQCHDQFIECSSQMSSSSHRQ